MYWEYTGCLCIQHQHKHFNKFITCWAPVPSNKALICLKRIIVQIRALFEGTSRLPKRFSKQENAHKIHDLAWLGHLKPSYMCVVVTGWPYVSARLIMPLKQASPSQRENSSFVIIDMFLCDKKTRLSWLTFVNRKSIECCDFTMPGYDYINMKPF